MSKRRYYADTQHVGEALRGSIDEDVDTHDETIAVSVYDIDAVMRGINYEEVTERNLDEFLMDAHLCSLQWKNAMLLLHFHEKVVDSGFTLHPAGTRAINANQAGDPQEVAPALTPVIEAVEDEYDVISWDFTEVSAASMANGGHFTDFEFEYVVTGPETPRMEVRL